MEVPRGTERYGEVSNPNIYFADFELGLADLCKSAAVRVTADFGD